MSTTATKKELVDFLWEWASGLGDWSKLLIKYIVRKEDALTIQERKEVFDYFLQSIGFKKGLVPLNISKPIYNATPKIISLTSLSNVKGVNRLAENQKINFGQNLTMIYGENASGKTGYGRILKALGFSYNSENVIYCDIDRAPVSQTATIDYTSNGKAETFVWDGSTSNQDLHTISFFNSNCVDISLSDNRELIVSPIGFHLFNIVTSELDRLSRMLNQTIRDHTTYLDWKQYLNSGTPQYDFIQTLSATSTEAELTEVSTYTCKEEKELKENEDELKNLNGALIETEISSLKLQIKELNDLISKIEDTEVNLNSANWEEIKMCNKELNTRENASKTSLQEIAQSRNIEFYQSEEFSNFIESAENYIKVLDKSDYPNSENEICIYCRQTLETEGKSLIINYRKMLNDNTQAEITSFRRIKENIITKVKTVDSTLIFHQPVFGLNKDDEIIQPDKISEYNKIVRELKSAIINDKVDDADSFHMEYSEYIGFLNDEKIQIEKMKIEKETLLKEISPRELEVEGRINELKDRKLLSSKVDEVKRVIKNKKIVAKLSDNENFFNTRSISLKTSEARDELIKQNFTRTFEEELKSLRKSQIKIELDFGTLKGQSMMQQKMNSNYLLKEILSDGEQNAISLAEFLTEVQLDSSQTPVVFDDPVTSLDHHIIDDIARRLINLSRERQVVIFTHSVLLFNSILYFSKQTSDRDLNNKFYYSKKEFGKSGVITETDEEINSPKFFIKKIEVLINNPSGNRPENEIASEGYGFLRSAIELCVEHEMFNGTVKRYQKNVALTSFIKVDGNLINKHKTELFEIFERCCCYIAGHSNPTIIQNDPTLDELKSDFAKFKEIRKEFINN